MTDTLTTRELALALGVSESSIKRWADEGTIVAARTAGGHRRIRLADAVRFVRETRAPLARPELLGLPDLAAAGERSLASGDAAERLFASLHAGATAEACGIVQAQFLAGQPVAAIVDGPLRQAMTRIGEQWRHDVAGIAREHRATDIAIQALNQLRSLLAPPPDAPIAVGGAPSGDPYVLPSLAAATVLAAEGLRAENLGPDLPLAAMHGAITILRPALVWLSVSRAEHPAVLAGEIAALARAVGGDGVSVVVGGRAMPPHLLPVVANLHGGASMAELAAFARGLAAAARSCSTKSSAFPSC